MICESCGQPFDIGDWPFCPHGKSTLAVRPDDVPGGFIVENGFSEPTRFDSHSAHERALAERGLEIRAKHAGEHDKIMSRWDTVDLTAAAALVSRGSQARREKQQRWAQASMTITVTEGGTFTGKDLQRAD